MKSMQWTGENQTEIVNWASGGWDNELPTGGKIWIKQKVLREDPFKAYTFLMVPIDGADVEMNPGDSLIKCNCGAMAVERAKR